MLARVGRLLEQKCRQSNVVARYGGDEFIILMPETGIEQAQVLAERLRLWLATDPMLEEHRITGSFGVASFPVHGFAMEELIRVADAGMYVSKHAGGNQVATAEPSAKAPPCSASSSPAISKDSCSASRLARITWKNSSATLRKLCAQTRTKQITGLIREAVEALAQAAELREHNAAGHGEKCAHYAGIIARGPESSDRGSSGRQPLPDACMTWASCLSPNGILNKSGALTEDEFAVMKTHPQLGVEVLARDP